MAFPEWITLSPGCFVCFDVFFRPVELAVYHDFIQVSVQDSHDGGFQIPVNALLSSILVEAPSAIEFGYCPTYQHTSMNFTLANTGEIEAPFAWDSPFPFSIEPAHGTLFVGEKKVMKVSIFPTTASVYVGKLVLQN